MISNYRWYRPLTPLGSSIGTQTKSGKFVGIRVRGLYRTVLTISMTLRQNRLGKIQGNTLQGYSTISQSTSSPSYLRHLPDGISSDKAKCRPIYCAAPGITRFGFEYRPLPAQDMQR